jgi:hypothetical protein
MYVSPDVHVPAGGAASPVRVFWAVSLGWITGALVGCFGAFAGWSWTKYRKSALLRGTITGSLAGYFAWYAGLIVLFIGFGLDGQTPLSAMIMSVPGAALNAIPGALIAWSWSWSERRRDLLPRTTASDVTLSKPWESDD